MVYWIRQLIFYNANNVFPTVINVAMQLHVQPVQQDIKLLQIRLALWLVIKTAKPVKLEIQLYA